MTAHDILKRLEQDRPCFHHMTSEDATRASAVGFTLPGDCNWSVIPQVLTWIADHVTGEMVTLETGAGYTTVLLASIAHRHFCCTGSEAEVARIRAYLQQLGQVDDKVTFVIGNTDATLPALKIGKCIDFAYIDGCHGYPFPALDWHYVDRYLKTGGVVGFDNAELRPVREHCDFMRENGAYRHSERVEGVCRAEFFEKCTDQHREWVDQPYSRIKRDPCDGRFATRVRRLCSRLIKPYLY